MDPSLHEKTTSKPEVSEYCLENRVRFSRSMIWQIQRRYYEEAGIEAWRQGVVPHYVTSNPTIAGAYAEIVFRFFHDRASISTEIRQPIYLLELGAGSGRFAFHFLRKLNELCRQTSVQLPDYRYIISDFSAKNIEFCRQHPRLTPFVEQGRLDFALFDAEKDTDLKLDICGEHLQPGNLSQPLVVFANYFFDSIPQDLFHIQNGKLYETGISLHSNLSSSTHSKHKTLEGVDVSYDDRPVSLPYYDEPILDVLLAEYRRKLSSTYLMFPHIGLSCLQRLCSLSTEGMLVLSADKGYHRTHSLNGRMAPKLTPHGNLCISLSVNYHAFQAFCEHRGGLALFAHHNHYSIAVSCLVMLSCIERYPETRMAYARFVSDFGPDDFFSLKKHFEKNIDSMGMRHIMAYLRLSGYDARLMRQFIPQLRKVLPQSKQTERDEMVEMIHKIWDWYYPIGEEHDMAFELGTLLYDMDAYSDALAFFQQSLDEYGGSTAGLYNMAICCTQLNQKEKGFSFLNEVLKIDPRHRAAIAMKQRLNDNSNI